MNLAKSSFFNVIFEVRNVDVLPPLLLCSCTFFESFVGIPWFAYNVATFP